MPKVTWIIENLVKEPSYIELAKAVFDNGYDLVPLNGDYNPEELDKFVGLNNVVVVASIPMTKLIRQKLPTAHCFCSFENYLCSKYYPYLGSLLFNDKYTMLPLRELGRLKWEVYGFLGRESTLFVRPDSGDKTFTGQIVDIQEIDRFIESNKDYINDLVIVSTPKDVLGEWRFVVNKHRQIIAVSCYRYRGLKTLVASAPKGATECCQKALETGYFPDDVFCIDVAEAADNKFYVMELTSFSSAGLYACDKNKIVNVVSNMVLGNFKI